jgi:hypothetical protein
LILLNQTSNLFELSNYSNLHPSYPCTTVENNNKNEDHLTLEATRNQRLSQPLVNSDFELSHTVWQN